MPAAQKTAAQKTTDNRMPKKKSVRAAKPAGSATGKSRADGKTAADGLPASLIEQNQNLRTTLEQIEKQFGEGSIMPLGSESRGAIRGISTGSISLDIALGGQGIPRGRIIEVFGPESSGKTTLALHVVAQAQKGEGIAAFIDAEHAFDPTWGKSLGSNLTRSWSASRPAVKKRCKSPKC